MDLLPIMIMLRYLNSSFMEKTEHFKSHASNIIYGRNAERTYYDKLTFVSLKCFSFCLPQ